MDYIIIHAVKKDDIKNESKIKAAAPRGALRLFCDVVSVDAMSGIRNDDRGLRGRCGQNIRMLPLQDFISLLRAETYPLKIAAYP